VTLGLEVYWHLLIFAVELLWFVGVVLSYECV